MKISKLFHWLYAILMLLPFAFFVPSVLYYAFNDNATMQTVEVPKIETISVDFNQLCEDSVDWSTTYYGVSVVFNNNEITLNGVPTDYGYAYNQKSFNVVSGHQYYFRTNTTGTSQSGSVWQCYSSGAIVGYTIGNCIYTAINSGVCHFQFAIYQGANLNVSFVMNVFDLTQMFGSGNEPTMAQFDLWFSNSYYHQVDSFLYSFEYDTGETEQLISNTDIINYAWESIWDLPLFSWCKVSFVATPFTYITGLFGLAPSNSFNYVFTYFASMSIIWLVFDVIMYVPLLVHRWLDKGIVE